jgi:hypothetical protein
MELRVTLKRLKIPVGVKVTDFVQKTSDSVKPQREINMKQEITIGMTEPDEQMFKETVKREKQTFEETAKREEQTFKETSKREEQTFKETNREERTSTSMLEENPSLNESADFKIENKSELHSTFGRKASDAGADVMNDFLEPKPEKNMKQETTIGTTEADEHTFTLKREKQTFTSREEQASTSILENISSAKESVLDVESENKSELHSTVWKTNPWGEKSVVMESENKWSPPQAFLEELTDQLMEEALEREFDEKHNVKCSQCGECFESPGILKTHLQIHTEVKPFKCLHCLKSFSQSDSLKTHLQTIHLRIHSKEKSFQCLEFSKSYTQSDDLKSHLCIHNREKPFNFKCLQCSKCFTQASNLKTLLKSIQGKNHSNVWSVQNLLSSQLASKGIYVFIQGRNHSNVQSVQ